MATFTIKTTVTGTVGGRSIDISNTYTVADIVHVSEEASTVTITPINEPITVLNKSSQTPRRGYHIYNGPVLYAIQVSGTGNLVQVDHRMGVGIAPPTMHIGTVPSVFHYSDQFNGHGNNDSGPSIPDPDENLLALEIKPSTSATLRAYALYKPVS